MRSKKGVAIPDELAAALRQQPDLLAVFETMRPSCQREYARWIAEAKKAETRAKRITSVLAQVAQWGGRHPAGGSD